MVLSSGNDVKDRLDYAIRVRESETPYRHILRWVVFRCLDKYSAEFRRSIDGLKATNTLLLSLTFHRVGGLVGDLADAEQFPKRWRLKKEWREARPHDYQQALWDVCRQFNLMEPLGSGGWRSGDGKPKPVRVDWGELLHCYLRHPASSDDFLSELISSGPTFASLPWLSRQPRRPGRPDPENPSQRDVAEASLVARRLAGSSWGELAEISSTLGLGTRDLAVLSEAHVMTRCRRLAKKLGMARLS